MVLDKRALRSLYESLYHGGSTARDVHPCDTDQAVSTLWNLGTFLEGPTVRLEAVASRFEDIEESTRQSLVDGPASRQGTSSPPAIVVEPVTPPSIAAFDAMVIDGKLSPFLELTKAFAPQLLIDQVSSLC